MKVGGELSMNLRYHILNTVSVLYHIQLDLLLFVRQKF